MLLTEKRENNDFIFLRAFFLLSTVTFYFLLFPSHKLCVCYLVYCSLFRAYPALPHSTEAGKYYYYCLLLLSKGVSVYVYRQQLCKLSMCSKFLQASSTEASNQIIIFRKKILVSLSFIIIDAPFTGNSSSPIHFKQII